jgi:predicted aspartyl protease
MLVKNYPFIKANSKDYARPYLPITIINPINTKDINTYALIDTGAYDIAMPAAFARPLGHQLKRGKLKKIRTGNGFAWVYTHTLRIEVFGFTTEILQVDFFPNLNIPLLGVKSFLSNFILTINYPHKCFSISLHQLHNK